MATTTPRRTGSGRARRAQTAVNAAGDAVRPPRQLRSEATFSRMVQAGHALIERHGSFEQVVVSEVIRLAKTSTGAFYGRFKDKDAFIEAVLAVAYSQLRERASAAAEPLAPGTPLTALEVAEHIVRYYVRLCRANLGLFQASLRHFASLNPDTNPMRGLNRHSYALFVPALAARLCAPGQDPAPVEREIEIALQMMVGTLVFTMLTNPGPLALDSAEMDSKLLMLMRRVLDLH
ncbi:hypothetical protein CCO03_00425 [Comamonas serinivorans]|uniref:HTH tetR-type domain-containing protein n=1 Tax=Comamonas serinivorans TaxID=1082851 RepID=A0A1Y0EID2_9BURK|nr:TetR/AcrR family transcriptional regulator [Comamonas serinivorans]ARU03356.1 hypothetical protein CCO03_00425 [Comamonas serinivorans]